MTLSLHIGIGCGPATMLHLGGHHGRWEYVLAGPAMSQACDAEPRAKSGETCLSPDAWAHVAHIATGRPVAPDSPAAHQPTLLPVEEHEHHNDGVHSGPGRGAQTPRGSDGLDEESKMSVSELLSERSTTGGEESGRVHGASSDAAPAAERRRATARRPQPPRRRRRPASSCSSRRSSRPADSRSTLRGWRQSRASPSAACRRLWRRSLLPLLRRYVPPAVVPRLQEGIDSYYDLSEMRQVSVMFVNCVGLALYSGGGVSDAEEAVAAGQETMLLVSEEVVHMEGQVNKMLVDDKGTVFLCVFGLPPRARRRPEARGADGTAAEGAARWRRRRVERRHRVDRDRVGPRLLRRRRLDGGRAPRVHRDGRRRQRVGAADGPRVEGARAVAAADRRVHPVVHRKIHHVAPLPAAAAEGDRRS